MNVYLVFAAMLAAFVALAHSWLGERHILVPLVRRGDLPRIRGSEAFTRRTMRFAWHMTSIAWLGFAAILLAGALPEGRAAVSSRALAIVAASFAAMAIATFVGSRGRHLAWPLLLAIALLTWLGA